MRSFSNPFRVPHSEHLRGDRAFLRSFAVAMLDVLPDDPWATPIIIRSPQGGGKTSLLRAFTAQSLSAIAKSPDNYPALAAKLSDLGALNGRGPLHLGVLLNLERDYRDLADIDAPDEVSQRLFFKLLDSRIMVAIIRAALVAKGLSYPEDVELLNLVPNNGTESSELIARLGGPTGRGLIDTAQRNEVDLLTLLDSLLAVDWRNERHGHADLYSLRVLTHSNISIGGKPLQLRPLILLDDGHHLASSQRKLLLRRLASRDLDVGRWYSERFEALSPQEMIAEVGMQGRDHFLVELSANYSGTAGSKRLPYEKIATEVANSRAVWELDRYGDEKDSFTELISVLDSELVGKESEHVIRALDDRLNSVAGNDDRYYKWLNLVRGTSGYKGMLARKEVEILIARDRARPQGELFQFPLDQTEVQRRSSSAVREAATLFLARDFGLPLYAGPKTLARLGSYNMAQFINLCGDLFDEMLGAITLRAKPHLNAERQNSLVNLASERLWREIPQRLIDGRLVQRLLLKMAQMAQRETFRQNAPYAPGVTGIAISMADRERLIRSGDRGEIPGMADLKVAMGAAIIDNMLTAEIDRWVKGENVMVLYLNRLLCPRFQLPLGRGGFMVMRLPQLCRWMVDVDPAEASVQQQLRW